MYTIEYLVELSLKLFPRCNILIKHFTEILLSTGPHLEYLKKFFSPAVISFFSSISKIDLQSFNGIHTPRLPSGLVQLVSEIKYYTIINGSKPCNYNLIGECVWVNVFLILYYVQYTYINIYKNIWAVAMFNVLYI